MYLSTLFIRSLKESTNAPFRLSVSTDIPLFQAQIDLHSDNGQGPRPIHWASRNGHVAVVDVLLGVSPRRDVSDIDRDINLTTYVYYRVVQLDFTQEIEVFNMLFDRCHIEKRKSSIKHHGEYFNFLCKFSSTTGPVQILASGVSGSYQFTVVLFLFFQADVPVDATDHKGLTPLMMACMFGRSLMAAYLLGRGARPHLTDMNGDSALHWAAYKGFPSLMQASSFSMEKHILVAFPNGP